MTDSLPHYSPSAPKKRNWAWPLVGIVVVLAVSGFFISRAGLDKALVKQKLDDFIVQLKAKGRAHGRDLDVTYGALEVTGGLTSKHVVIHNATLSIKPLNQKPLAPGAVANADALLVTTPVLEVYPEAADLSAVRISLPQPVNFAAADAPDKSLLKITGATPIAVSIAQIQENNVPMTRIRYHSPASVDFTYLREQHTAGAEDATPNLVPVYDTLHTAFAADSNFESSVAADGSALGHSKLNFGPIVITPQSSPVGTVTVAALNGDWSNTLNDKKQNVVHGIFTLGPITAAPELLPYAPVAWAFDVTYEGAMPQTPEAVAGIQSQESAFHLKTFTFTTKDAGLNATANFTANASDVLPVGTANLTITNMPAILQALRKNNLLNPDNELLADALIQQITATPVDKLKDTTVAIERTRGGSFKIGQTTFEELFASFLKIAMQHRSATPPAAETPAGDLPAGTTKNIPVPTLPPADKVKLKPIALPDNSVRG